MLRWHGSISLQDTVSHKYTHSTASASDHQFAEARYTLSLSSIHLGSCIKLVSLTRYEMEKCEPGQLTQRVPCKA